MPEYIAVFFKLAHLSIGCREEIYITNYFTIIKSEVLIFTSVDISFCGCVAQVAVPSYSVDFISIPGNLGLVSFITPQFYDVRNNRIHYGPIAVFICLHFTLSHYHHCAGLSEGIGLLKYL